MDVETNLAVSDCGIADLPTEIIIKIFEYLDGADLRVAATVCHSWLNVSKCSEFMPINSSLYIDLDYRTFDRQTEPYSIFTAKTMFNYNAVTFDVVAFYEADVVKKFCAVHADTLQRIVLRRCTFHNSVLLEMLRCPLRLTHLELNAVTFGLDDFPIVDTQLRLNDITHLTLKSMNSLTDAQFSVFMAMVPNVTALSLYATGFSCHPGLYRKFHPPTGGGSRPPPYSPYVLTFRHVGSIICGPAAANLTHLDFSLTMLNDQALSVISSCAQLRLVGLNLAACRELTEDSLLELFCKQPQLRQLNLSVVDQVTDRCMALLCDKLHDLRELRLNCCNGLTDRSFGQVGALRRLRVLEISNTKALTCLALVGLTRNRNDCLRELRMRSCPFDVVIEKVFMNCPNLRVLDIGKNRTWQPIALKWIGIYLLGLFDLRMPDCNLFVDIREKDTTCNDVAHQANSVDDNPGLSSLSSLRGLGVLNISGCTLVTDSLLRYGLRLPQLHTLMLARLPAITGKGIELLVQNFPLIRTVDLSKCPLIDDLSVELVGRQFRRRAWIRKDDRDGFQDEDESVAPPPPPPPPPPMSMPRI